MKTQRYMDSEKKNWDALATVKNFDIGIPNAVLHESTPRNNEQIDVINQPTTTPISLLVQSLVQQLCSLLENDPTRANQLYHSICEKLHSMKLIDDTYSMGEFEVMRSQYQRALYQLVAVASGSELPIPLPISWPIVQPTGLEWSRYHREFEELYFIAGGGFGSVFKARHRLDGVEYAVKKIYIRSSDVNSVMSHLAEVKTIASLNHTNIVNYKAAWLEPMIEANVKKKTIKMETDSYLDNYSSVYTNILKSFKTHNSKELFNQNTQSDFSISFERSDGVYDYTETNSDESTADNITPSSDAMCKMLMSKEYQNCSRVNLKWATLYIQMVFCQQTLKQWLDERNLQMQNARKNSCEFFMHSDSVDSTDSGSSEGGPCYQITPTHIGVIIDMFTQLVQGLHYIHGRGIIHHDVKPSNVFVASAELGVRVQLGDFGLACPLQQSHRGNAVGTQLYAAPEQLEGQCNPKSDMYSLGIVLLELVETFSTDMERVKTIDNLRKGHIPAQLTANYPKIAHIIGKLVQRRPGKRLDTAQLLEELKLLSENKDETIKCLKAELAAKDDEIATLKRMLAEMSKR